MNALDFGRRRSTKFLLEKGADYTKPGKCGMTVLEVALKPPVDEDCLETLLEYIESKKGGDFVSNYVNRTDFGSKRTLLSGVDCNTKKILLKYEAKSAREDPVHQPNMGSVNANNVVLKQELS